jgi:hypothetical protein
LSAAAELSALPGAAAVWTTIASIISLLLQKTELDRFDPSRVVYFAGSAIHRMAHLESAGAGECVVIELTGDADSLLTR